MPSTDKRVDAYIARAPEFARPVLTQIRATVHAACPDCEEDIKWGAPAFMYKGILFMMASFKEYCAINFWKGALIVGDDATEGVAGQLGKLKQVSDLPSKKVLTGYIKKAMALNESGTAVAKRVPRPKTDVVMPDYFMVAIRKSKRALAGYEKFSASQQREYIEWITSAKGEATRDRRVKQAVEWMAEGKSRNWKYQ
jgi:uncharacterized protein YdeI (YjbR/CyaY-like superfamily)